MQFPTGRAEPRLRKTEVVELLQFDDAATLKLEAIIENVSSSGARLIINSTCPPGKLVHFDAPEEHLHLSARVVYCQRLTKTKFAVGLQLTARVKEWQKVER